MKLVKGYGGQSDVFLALERGEVQGNTTGSTNLRSDKAEWVTSGKVRILLRYSLGRSAGLDDVPSALDLVTGEDDRAAMRFFLAKYKIARALFAPPGVPPERVLLLRRAFDATMTDPAFLAEAATVGFEVSPTRGGGTGARRHAVGIYTALCCSHDNNREPREEWPEQFDGHLPLSGSQSSR